MKQLKTILLIFTLAFALVGCKTNNGDIGLYYGSWALDKITIDGVEDASWCSTDMWTTWSFQNNVICIQRTNDLQDSESYWGTWTETDGVLELDYRHSEDGVEAGTSKYRAPTWIYFEAGTVVSLKIENQTSKAMVLTMTDAAGRKITYSLRKTHK